MNHIDVQHSQFYILCQLMRAGKPNAGVIIDALNFVRGSKLTLDQFAKINRCLDQDTFLTDDEQQKQLEQELLKVCEEAKKRNPNNQKRLKVILASALCLSVSEIQRIVDCTYKFVQRWCSRFFENGFDGLKDKPHTGRPHSVTEEELEGLFGLLSVKPSFIARTLSHIEPSLLNKLAVKDFWTIADLSLVMGISKSTVRRILNRHNLLLSPDLSKTYCFSNDPEFEEKLRTIVNVYDLPKDALSEDSREIEVLCFDEMPEVSVRESLYCQNVGQKVTAGSEYVRHGTQTIFAALNKNTGQVICAYPPDKTRARVESFLDEILSSDDYKDKHVYIVMDNINTHKKLSKEWHEKYDARVEICYTPTHCSWANLVETFFSIYRRCFVKNHSWASIEDFRRTSELWVQEYNSICSPYKWSFRDLQVYFDQRRDTINSVAGVTQTPTNIDVGMQQHVISAQNAAIQAKVNMQNRTAQQNGEVLFNKELSMAKNREEAALRLMQIQFAKFEVNSDSVRSLINQTNDALALVRQTHFQLADFEIQLSKAVDKEQKQAIKEQLYELKKQFKDVVKQGLKLVKDCCACIPKEREAIKSLGNIVKKVRLLKQAKVHSPYENSMDSMQWVKHAWGLINNP